MFMVYAASLNLFMSRTFLLWGTAHSMLGNAVMGLFAAGLLRIQRYGSSEGNAY